CYQYYSGSTF
nr:immunoglobulin light chain junction region [Macaca mulatta]MOV61216.1 immunoglobulin light chain junction region [Macaca mulatta]MOV61270.1 immunoglobulin light chain junction region [Macaca mulatta]MOV61303.1 immunoglobulin light chain junction region [Macaca mulatta]MOV61374.1 immunoglobulin light chain junction region [Macaca mulatta]